MLDKRFVDPLFPPSSLRYQGHSKKRNSIQLSQEDVIEQIPEVCQGLSLCLTLLAGMGFAQKLVTLQVKEGDSAYIKGAKPMFALIPRVNETPAANQPDVQVPIFAKTFRFNKTTFTYHIVGTDPAAGSATSNIP